jgi:glycosyltransferase involved in cell wall biosynthesis
MQRPQGMRILHCIPTMRGGGAERQLTLLTAGQIRSGIEVFVVPMHGGQNLATLEATGARVVSPKVLGNHDPRVILQIAKLIRQERIDLVQTWLPQMDVFGGLAALWTGVPHILSERSCRDAYPLSFKHMLRVAVGRFANAVAANSLGGLEYWRGKNPSRLNRVIRNVVSIDPRIGNISPKKTEGEDKPRRRLLYAGRYIPSKNLVNLLKALALVLPRFPDAVVEFYGEGPLEKELLGLRDALGLRDRVAIADYLDPLIAKLKETTIFVSPSSFEGNPNAVIEAAACGCTLVVSDIPAHREFLDDSCAYFVDCNSPSSIAGGLEQALLHPEEARRKGRAASDRVSAWTIETITSQYLSLYQDVLAERGGRAV